MAANPIFAPRDGRPAGGVHGFNPENVRLAQGGMPSFEREPSHSDPIAIPRDPHLAAAGLQNWAEYRCEVHFDRPEPKIYPDPKWMPGARPMHNHFAQGYGEFAQNPMPFQRAVTAFQLESKL